MGHLTLCLAKITFQMSAHEGCVVVTGAAGGIGRNICRVLNKKGFKVILVDKVDLGPLEDELGLTGKNRSFQVDLKDFDKVEEMVKRVDFEHGGINVLINNAGINLGPCLFKKEARENWLEVINVNNIGMLNITSVVFPIMTNRKSGHIVNISSVTAQSPWQNHIVYGATKSFIDGFSKGLRREGLAEGVKVTIIRPGAVQTDLVDSSVTLAPEVDGESMTIQNDVLERLNAPKIPWLFSAEDVGEAVAHVISLPGNVAVNELTITASGFQDV